MEWVFSGIGTEIVILVIGMVTSGVVGYKIGIKSNSKQVQKAKNEAKQQQDIVIENTECENTGRSINTSNKQIQKAGKGSSQTQIGRIKNGI